MEEGDLVVDGSELDDKFRNLVPLNKNSSTKMIYFTESHLIDAFIHMRYPYSILH